MEEKILEKLDKMESRFDTLEKMFKSENAKLKEDLRNELRNEFKQECDKLATTLRNELRNEFKQECDKLATTLRNEFKQECDKLATTLRNEFKQECDKFEAKLRNELKQDILNHMFVFEEEYGRKLTIAFETLSSKNANEEIQDESILDLKKMTNLNTAYVYNHEDRLDKLEKVNL